MLLMILTGNKLLELLELLEFRIETVVKRKDDKLYKWKG